MNEEEIKKAAKETLINESIELQATKVGTFQRGFIAGAQWRINSVWHDVSEKPENGRYILVDKECRIQAVWKQNIEDDWLNDVNHFEITRWAYISDLFPERKEETE